MENFGKIAYAATFDLISGVTISMVMTSVFGNEILPNEPSVTQVFYMLFEIALQGLLTIFISAEIRDFFLGKDFEDPTGGILFILSVFRQPNFWRRVDSVSSYLSDKILGFFTGKDMDMHKETPEDFISQ